MLVANQKKDGNVMEALPLLLILVNQYEQMESEQKENNVMMVTLLMPMAEPKTVRQSQATLVQAALLILQTFEKKYEGMEFQMTNLIVVMMATPDLEMAVAQIERQNQGTSVLKLHLLIKHLTVLLYEETDVKYHMKVEMTAIKQMVMGDRICASKSLDLFELVDPLLRRALVLKNEVMASTGASLNEILLPVQMAELLIVSMKNDLNDLLNILVHLRLEKNCLQRPQ